MPTDPFTSRQPAAPRLDRRRLLAGAAAALAVVPVPFAPALAAAAEVRSAVEAILAGRIPGEAGLTVDAPDLAENGAQVPIRVAVDSPMTPDDHVTAIHLVATANPVPGLTTFRLTPRLGRAEVFTRVRLAEAQEVLVLAELSDGRVLSAAVRIAVTAGGCAT